MPKFYAQIQTSAGRFIIPIGKDTFTHAVPETIEDLTQDLIVEAIRIWAKDPAPEPLSAVGEDGDVSLIWPQPGMSATIVTEETLHRRRQEAEKRAAAAGVNQPRGVLVPAGAIPRLRGR